MKKHAKPGTATWICSSCGHRASRRLSTDPIFEQIAKARCSNCGAKGNAVVVQGDREYGLTESFNALRSAGHAPETPRSAEPDDS